MKSRIYIETSIPSFYYEVRNEPEMVARREWTRRFWAPGKQHYDLVTSEAVLNELESGRFPGKDDAIHLINELPLVAVEPGIASIVESYIAQKVMPRDPSGDALHLALASYHECEFLLTWNCKHLANANKFGHIRIVNVMSKRITPVGKSGNI